jgi:hypothetical protein
MVNSKTIFCFLFFFSVANVFAQKAKTHVLTSDEAKVVKKDAATMFASEDYNGALKAYLDLYKTNPQSTEFNYRIAYCYLQTTVNKAASLKYIEKAMESKDAKKEWSFQLGLANMYNNKWDEAIKAFNDFKDAKNKPLKDYPTVERMIEMCNNGKTLTANPVNCKYTNLGKTVNTPFDEYNPFISGDGKSLLFTSRRKGNIGGFIEDLGIYSADIYSTVWKDTIWNKARGMGGMINTEWDEETVGLTANGDQVFIYFDNSEAYADVGIASLKGKTWQKPLMFPEVVNSKQYEGGATISLDGSTVYFSSDRKEGKGGIDIWMVTRDNSGEWGTPVNAGNINTKYDDDFPRLSADGRSLYFSSKGWNSMGGYDVFRSEWNAANSSWGTPENIGHPLNDADDNAFISMTADSRFAYVSAVRPEGLGDRDIYKVEFMDTTNHPFMSYVSGVVTAATSGRIELTKVSLQDKNSSRVIEYKPGTASHQFILPAPPGQYILKIEGYNFAPYTEDVEITNEFPPKEITRPIQVTSSK